MATLAAKVDRLTNAELGLVPEPDSSTVLDAPGRPQTRLPDGYWPGPASDEPRRLQSALEARLLELAEVRRLLQASRDMLSLMAQQIAERDDRIAALVALLERGPR